jgi:hypothetical protein
MIIFTALPNIIFLNLIVAILGDSKNVVITAIVDQRRRVSSFDYYLLDLRL